MSHAPVMTIDGPSGSGKGTVSRAAARALGWALLDSGALYRLVALAGRQKGVDLADEPGLARLAQAADMAFGSGSSGEEVVRLDGKDVTGAIRTEEAGNDASKVAALPGTAGIWGPWYSRRRR
jgi:cytidylate kinase